MTEASIQIKLFNMMLLYFNLLLYKWKGSFHEFTAVEMCFLSILMSSYLDYSQFSHIMGTIIFLSKVHAVEIDEREV